MAAGKFNNKREGLSEEILEEEHNEERDYMKELEGKYLLLEERLGQMEEKYASLISVFSSLENHNGDTTIQK